MKLEDCTKDELIYYIRRQEKQSGRALVGEVFFAVMQKLDDELLNLQDLSRRLTEEYISLTTPTKKQESITGERLERAIHVAEQRRGLAAQMEQTEIRQRLLYDACTQASERGKR